MIQCSYCPKGFVETANGLAEKTFHEMLHHDPNVINVNTEPKGNGGAE